MRDPQDQLAAVGVLPPEHAEAYSVDLAQFLRAQIEWSTATFGPGNRTEGLIDHVRSELDELWHAPSEADELGEWIDVAILALDGAWRCGYTPEEVCRALLAKAERNRRRGWPDWRTAAPGRAIQHLTEGDDPK